MTVPKLRFKEFINDWKITSLGSEIGISSASRVLKEQWRASGVPFFRTSDVISIFKSEENQKVFISYDLFETLSNKSGRIKKGDLLITGGGSIGIPYLKKDNSPLYFKDADLLWLKSSEKINGEFLYNFFQSQSFKVYLKSISHTGTISHFTIEQAKTTPINLPSKEEQTKIANFLTTVDKKISQLNEQHQLMIQYKKGVMQKIFNQEIRFKDDNGEDFGEWEEKKLSDIANFRRGSFPQPYGLAKWLDPNGMPFVQVFDVSDNLKLKNFTKIKISKLAQEKSVFVKKGTLIITIQGTIGRVAKMQYDAYVDRTLLIFQSYKIDVNIDFIKYALFLLFELEKEKADGGVIKTITKETLSSFTLQLPSIKEQAKIANFLAVLDEKINNTFEELQTVKQWKKGLLQQMLV